MGKRTNATFIRNERDFYPTPAEAVVPLLPHLTDVRGYIEPCAGNGDLIDHLAAFGHECVWSFDLEPGTYAAHVHDTHQGDVMHSVGRAEIAACEATHFITNPPWPHPRAGGQPTLAMIEHMAELLPTWLLLAADFAHNDYAQPVMAYCKTIVSVGRLRWIEGSANKGVDNAAWFLFDKGYEGPTVFITRGDGSKAYASEIAGLV